MMIEDRKKCCGIQRRKRVCKITLDDNGDYAEQSIGTIISEGDAIGSVVLYNRDEKCKMGETESKLVSVAAGFLGRQMEQ